LCSFYSIATVFCFHIASETSCELLRAFAQVRLVSFVYRNGMEKANSTIRDLARSPSSPSL
jgi:hypothetical protein